jgi:hypothetical protein
MTNEVVQGITEQAIQWPEAFGTAAVAFAGAAIVITFLILAFKAD